MLARVDTQCLEGSNVKFDRVARNRFQDDLELGVLLKTVGVLTIASIVRAHRRLDVSDVPGFGTEHAQKSGGIHGASTDLGVIGLPDQAAVCCPEFLQFKDDGLKV